MQISHLHGHDKISTHTFLLSLMRAGRSDCVTCKTVSLGGAGSYESDFARLNNSSISCVHEM